MKTYHKNIIVFIFTVLFNEVMLYFFYGNWDRPLAHIIWFVGSALIFYFGYYRLNNKKE